MSDDEARKRILERRAQFIRAAITSAGIGSASVVMNACDNPLARPCLEPPPATTTKPPTAQPCLEPMPDPSDAGPGYATPNPSVAPNPSTAPSASANSGAPPDGSSAASAAKRGPTPPLTAPTQTVVKPPPMPCLKPVAPPKSR